MSNLKLAYENHSDGEVSDLAPVEMAIAQWTGDLLERTYPGHPWHADVTLTNFGGRIDGVIKLQIMGIMPANMWWSIQASKVHTDPGGKTTILKGAGELLERYGLPRSGFDRDTWRQVINKYPLNGRGHIDPLR